jgi:hypothetical protein
MRSPNIYTEKRDAFPAFISAFALLAPADTAHILSNAPLTFRMN